MRSFGRLGIITYDSMGSPDEPSRGVFATYTDRDGNPQQAWTGSSIMPEAEAARWQTDPIFIEGPTLRYGEAIAVPMEAAWHGDSGEFVPWNVERDFRLMIRPPSRVWLVLALGVGLLVGAGAMHYSMTRPY